MDLYPVNIGDAAELTAVSAKAMHHYESMDLIRPTGGTPSGYARTPRAM